jgi:hypothetical protein
VVIATPLTLYPPVPIVQEVGRVPGPISTGAANLAPTGIRSSESPARSESLYLLRYTAPRNNNNNNNKLFVVHISCSTFLLTRIGSHPLPTAVVMTDQLVIRPFTQPYPSFPFSLTFMLYRYYTFRRYCTILEDLNPNILN